MIIRTDNQAAMSMINKGTSKNDIVLQAFRTMHWLSSVYNFHVIASFIPEHSNVVADAISRLKDRRFLNKFITMLPPHARYIPLINNMSLSWICSILLDSCRLCLSK